MKSQTAKLQQLSFHELVLSGRWCKTRFPPGFGLLLVGSGIYWILSSQLIASFTVLAPGIFDANDTGISLVLTSGVVASTVGLWIIDQDLNFSLRLLAVKEGWAFLIPMFLVAGDLSVTMIGISSSRSVVELNPMVSMVLGAGSSAFAAFAISYMALSQGLALLMLHLGLRWFPSGSGRFIPYGATCGAASVGLGSNLSLLILPGFLPLSYIGGATTGILLAVLLIAYLRNAGLGGL